MPSSPPSGLRAAPNAWKQPSSTQRMHVERDALESRGKRHICDRLALPCPETLQRAEGRSEVDPHRGLGTVVVGEVHRRECRLEPFRIERSSGRRGAGRGPTGTRPSACSVQPSSPSPRLRMRTRSDAPSSASSSRTCTRRPVSADPILGVLVGEDQGALHLEVLDDRRFASLREAGRRGHGAVKGARRDQPAEDAVVVQPRRIGG